MMLYKENISSFHPHPLSHRDLWVICQNSMFPSMCSVSFSVIICLKLSRCLLSFIHIELQIWLFMIAEVAEQLQCFVVSSSRSLPIVWIVWTSFHSPLHSPWALSLSPLLPLLLRILPPLLFWPRPSDICCSSLTLPSTSVRAPFWSDGPLFYFNLVIFVSDIYTSTLLHFTTESNRKWLHWGKSIQFVFNRIPLQ